jgi:hypothetical protein
MINKYNIEINIMTLLKVMLIIQIMFVLNTYNDKVYAEKDFIRIQIQELENRLKLPTEFELPDLIIKD